MKMLYSKHLKRVCIVTAPSRGENQYYEKIRRLRRLLFLLEKKEILQVFEFYIYKNTTKSLHLQSSNCNMASSFN